MLVCKGLQHVVVIPSIRLWWAQVMETPEANRTVLSNGTSRGLSV